MLGSGQRQRVNVYVVWNVHNIGCNVVREHCTGGAGGEITLLHMEAVSRTATSEQIDRHILDSFCILTVNELFDVSRRGHVSILPRLTVGARSLLSSFIFFFYHGVISTG